MKYRIFISSVQDEFAAERKALKQYLLSDPLLGEYVESVFIFEDHPAAKKRPGEIYLPKLADTDIYIGLFGAQYGNRVPKNEMSPTEREYDAATAHGLTKWIYVFDDETPIDPRMARLRKKAAGDHTYRHVKDRSILNQEVYASFISFLRERNELTREPFESVVVQDAMLEDDIDHDRVRWFVDTARRERKLAAKVGETDEKLLVHLKLMNRKTRALSRAAIKTSKKTTKETKATSKKTSKKTRQVFLLPDGLSDAARKIAETMLSNPWISARGAAEMLGLTQQGVQYHLARLSSVLHHEGGDKGGRWVLGPKPKGKRGAK